MLKPVIESARRLAVAVEAMRHVDSAHYLMAGHGERPLGASELWPMVPNLTPRRPVVAGPKSPWDFLPMMFAAKGKALVEVKGKLTWTAIACAGRYMRTRLPHAITNHRLFNDRNLKVSHLGAREMKELRDRMSVSVNFRWPRHLTLVKSGWVYWGECCLNRYHFDCAGFVDYCLAKGTGRKIRFYSVSGWRTALKKFRAARIGTAEARAGDIVMRPGHIGLVTKSGVVAHAKDIFSGVVQEALKASDWKEGCFSLPTSFWVPEIASHTMDRDWMYAARAPSYLTEDEIGAPPGTLA